MKKTKLTRSLLAACSIVALSAVMYGCTHSGGPSQTDLDAANAATAAADAEAKVNADAAAAAAVQAKADADAAAADAATAAADAKAAADEAAADAAAAASDAAAAAATLAKAAADEAAAAAAAAATLAKAAADEAAAAAAVALAKADEERLAAEKRAQDLQGELDKDAATKASDDAKELLNMALRNRMVTVVEDPQDTPQDTPAEMLIQAKKPSPMLSVSNEGVLVAKATIEATTTAAAIVYTKAEMAPDMIEGWRGATLTEMGGNDTAVVYSDIGNDGTKSLLDRYTSNLPTPTSARSWDIGVDAMDDSTADNVPWSAVRRPDETTTAGGARDNPLAMFTGTVHSIPGTFSCDAAADATLCVAPEAFTDGMVNAEPVGDEHTWKFTPDEGATTYTNDPDYLVFGWWLDKGEDDKPNYVRLITSATGLDVRTNDSTLGTALRGDATYTGAAAGKYAMASAAEDMYEGGHFTATATLMVDFDADLVPASADGSTGAGNDRDGVSLSGTIDNFMTGDTPRDNWSVTLTADGTPDLPDMVDTTGGVQAMSSLDDSDASMTTEWSTGAAQTGTGTWTAMFYGGDSNGAAANDLMSNTAHPTAVIGTFNAHIGTDDADTGAIGRLQGAFGANKE